MKNNKWFGYGELKFDFDKINYNSTREVIIKKGRSVAILEKGFNDFKQCSYLCLYEKDLYVIPEYMFEDITEFDDFEDSNEESEEDLFDIHYIEQKENMFIQ